jgi:peptidoglycan/LPS O-acetylase OafA/YrhL
LKADGGKIGYLEGLRGLAALTVLYFHMVATFLTGLINTPPFNMVFSGELAVCVFFVLSGFVLSHAYFKRPDREIAISGLFRRYFRLAPIAIVTSFAGFILYGVGYWLYHHGVSSLSFVEHTGIGTPSLVDALGQGFYTVFIFAGTATYNPVLWTLYYEFIARS